MNRLTRAAALLVMVTGISLGAEGVPAIAAATSAGHPGAPGVFHCC